jgi:hypothetical protein
MGASMKIISLSAVGLTLLFGLTACFEKEIRITETYGGELAKARACVDQFDPQGKSSQIMTYDTKTKTEVHLNTDGRFVNVTGQNATDNTSLGMKGKVGKLERKEDEDQRVDYCTEDSVRPDKKTVSVRYRLLP